MVSKNRIKILFFNTEDKIGGGEISLISLLSALKEDLYKTVVVCPPGHLSKKLKENNIAVIPVTKVELRKIRLKFCEEKFYVLNPLSCLYNLFLLCLSTFRLNKVIRKIEPHLIHANTPRAMAHIALPAILNNIPIIWHIRILPVEKIATEKLYIWFLSLFAKKIIAISKAVRERLKKFGVASDKISVIYNPIDTRVFFPQNKHSCRSKFNLPMHSTIVGSIGRLHRGKGYEVMLKAAAIIKDKYKNINFLIAGQEWKKDYRMELVDFVHHLGLSRNFTIMDWQQNVCCLVSSLDILILVPTCNEGFGRILAEAMACKVPVIGSSVGGINEIIENEKDGILVPPGDESSLAEAIITLLENKKLAAQLVKRGRKKVKAKFALNKHVKNIEQLYGELMQSP